MSKIDFKRIKNCDNFSLVPSTINGNVKMPCSIKLNQKHFCDKHSSLATEKVLLDRPVDVPAWRHDIQHNDTQHNDISIRILSITTLGIQSLFATLYRVNMLSVTFHLCLR